MRSVKRSEVAHNKTKKNPLKDRTLMKRLNPYNEKRRAAQTAADNDRHTKRVAALKQKRKDKNLKKAK